ncbi:1-deoxy-D-xylulose-5-phosphate reductoisomerase [Marinomonas mediterranea]|uniref:1-deoxy-D-xylulose 5-phosphate reductoisomerase n=1 Tax=Marinomonas mediterranea (strain ATCC 700492 / JCM 21426 / NBRC 103028 / MMB-1) TaxID=717774 RepID=F2JU04_MARM1|nr:1-deoxy-D-xylulose-5-phosphate reductoisomerase [Marinomonas mediterranea]ADZ90425.1 1-deoxy-D-xylulose 5-phosphate reductoisomerase [Marinomonas mediterranea MMB-1]
MKQKICLLGATGSIGKSTLDVIALNSAQFELESVAANQNVERMAEICKQFRPSRAVMGSIEARDRLAELCPELSTSFEYGSDAMESIASDPNSHQVMAAIMGFAGLKPTLAAIRAGKRVLLANKESLVTAGKLFMDEVKSNSVTLMPIDSEHNAIFQSLPHNSQYAHKSGVDRLMLTASGGPFRTWSKQEMASVTPEQACKHPNWSMGRKISVDSASLMNKGLELIEACWLFDVTPDDIDVVVHPESVIHSLVSYIDGSVICQMGNPDMKIPVAYGMTWPNRAATGVKPLNLFEVSQLNFEKPDLNRFPNLRLASEAWFSGGSAMATLNAANEVAVDAFLNNKIRFLQISELNQEVLERSEVIAVNNLDVVFDADKKARAMANKIVGSWSMK